MRAVAGDGLRHHLGGEARRLHGAQRLIVDRNRARLVHHRRVALDQRASNAIDAEQIGKRQPGRAGADDGDGKMRAHTDSGSVPSSR